MRLRRIIKVCLFGTSLLLCAAIISLWVRSLTIQDDINYSWPTMAEGRYSRIDWTAYSQIGFITFVRQQIIPTTDEREQLLKKQDQRSGWKLERGVADSYDATWSGFIRGFSGFGIESGVQQHGDWRTPVHSMSFPLWLPLLLASLPADIAFLRILRHRRAHRRARRRAARNHCPTCNYDLRATPGRCPECGSEAASSPPA
jgi:hypothetical protein